MLSAWQVYRNSEIVVFSRRTSDTIGTGGVGLRRVQCLVELSRYAAYEGNLPLASRQLWPFRI